jgi:hypothetical protein
MLLRGCAWQSCKHGTQLISVASHERHGRTELREFNRTRFPDPLS